MTNNIDVLPEIEELLDEYSASSCCDAILSAPAVNTPNDMNTRLYSEEQILEAFRLGVVRVFETDAGKEILRSEMWKKRVKPYPIMRCMNVGDTFSFPCDRWNAARTAASTLKKQFSSGFNVFKKYDNGSVPYILVTRTH